MAPSIVTVHVLMPEQSPDQPSNVEVTIGVAVSVTMASGSKSAVHVDPQSMPAGSEVTEPAPAPARATVSGCETFRSASIPTPPSPVSSIGGRSANLQPTSAATRQPAARTLIAATLPAVAAAYNLSAHRCDLSLRSRCLACPCSGTGSCSAPGSDTCP
ncbi:MAG: hypothetical protein F9K40_09515 [Kofleriaceae bacterium]|nr:MAG: hypothetical protein F9K40_09515 [Kofleriaceae bacterium]